MDRVKQLFQASDWNALGWSEAYVVLTGLLATENPETLSPEEKWQILSTGFRAVTKSLDWLEFFIATSEVLTEC